MRLGGLWLGLVACGGCSLTQSLDHLAYSEGDGGAAATGPGGGATPTSSSAVGSTTAGSSASSSGQGGAGQGGAGQGGAGQGGSGQGGAGQGGAGQGGAPPFCAPGEHDFCVDFESGLGDWTYESQSKGAELGTSTDESTSPTSSLRAFVAGHDDGYFYATVSRDFVRPWAPMAISFQLLVLSTDWQPEDINAGVLVLSCPAFDADGIEITVGASFSVGEDYVSVNFTHLEAGQGLTLAPVTFGQWQRVELELQPGEGLTGTFGEELVERAWPSPIEPDTAQCTIRLGVDGYNAPAPDMTVFIDDVTVDFAE